MSASSPDNASTPVISIITVVRNGATTIERCLQSVRDHGGPGVEHIVLDGASTDGTPDILRCHAAQLAFWHSEPDRGIYDAMNKGVRHARGRWVLFLGCDDMLVADLAPLIPRLADARTIYYGDAFWPALGRAYDGPFTAAKLALTNICHQAMFYPRAVFDTHAFNLRYPYQADWEFNMRCFSDPRFRFEYLGVTLSRYDDACGLSSTRRDTALEQDYIRLLWRHFPVHVAAWRSCITLGGRTLRAFGWRGQAPYTKKG